MKFKYKFFDELTVRELYEIIRAREDIFLLEQKIVCQDLDRIDYDSLHCYIEDSGRIMAYLRCYKTENGDIKLGRVLTAEHGRGLGARLMREALPVIKEIFNTDTLIIHSQKHAQGFYEKFGFRATSDEFLEEGVLHIAMRLEP